MDAETSSRAFRTDGRFWLRDFDFGLTGLTVRKTGARVPYSPSVASEVTAWFRFFFSSLGIEPLGPQFTIAFSPEPARPWYLVWHVARAAGGKLIQDVSKADVVMHFEDATFSPNPQPRNLKPGARVINFNCRDVSKSQVAKVFAETFGYSLAVDPGNHVGLAVEKSEINAAHDGAVIQCPAPAQTGRVYQKLIECRAALNPDLVEDLRTCTVGGKPACVFLKRRPVTKRFSNSNVEVKLARVDAIFSRAEQDQITAFTRGLGLDWGGLDVLRDRGDGRLYIVDANKTDMGPPIALALPEKVEATRMLAQAFRDFVSRPV